MSGVALFIHLARSLLVLLVEGAGRVRPCAYVIDFL